MRVFALLVFLLALGTAACQGANTDPTEVASAEPAAFAPDVPTVGSQWSGPDGGEGRVVCAGPWEGCREDAEAAYAEHVEVVRQLVDRPINAGVVPDTFGLVPPPGPPSRAVVVLRSFGGEGVFGEGVAVVPAERWPEGWRPVEEG